MKGRRRDRPADDGNKFDMNDMLAQFAQIRKMGGAGAMLSMMPGMSGIDASQIDEKAFDRIEP